MAFILPPGKSELVGVFGDGSHMGPLVIEARDFKSEVKFYLRGQFEVIDIRDHKSDI